MKQGAKIRLTLEADGIRITPEQTPRAGVEKHALRFVLANLGDAATIEVKNLPDGSWLVNVFGVGWPEPLGKLYYDQEGNMLSEHSDTPDQMRRAAEKTLPQ